MLNLIEIELTRIRRMAERANDDFLLYIIDMAILEANRMARCAVDDVSALHASAEIDWSCSREATPGEGRDSRRQSTGGGPGLRNPG